VLQRTAAVELTRSCIHTPVSASLRCYYSTSTLLYSASDSDEGCLVHNALPRPHRVHQLWKMQLALPHCADHRHQAVRVVCEIGPLFVGCCFSSCLSRACLGKHDCLHEAMKKNRGSSFRTSKAFKHPAGVVHLERSTAQKGAARCLHSAPLALPGRPRHDRHAIDGHQRPSCLKQTIDIIVAATCVRPVPGILPAERPSVLVPIIFLLAFACQESVFEKAHPVSSYENPTGRRLRVFSLAT
jgi:hypothetical protein